MILLHKEWSGCHSFVRLDGFARMRADGAESTEVNEKYIAFDKNCIIIIEAPNEGSPVRISEKKPFWYFSETHPEQIMAVICTVPQIEYFLKVSLTIQSHQSSGKSKMEDYNDSIVQSSFSLTDRSIQELNSFEFGQYWIIVSTFVSAAATEPIILNF